MASFAGYSNIESMDCKAEMQQFGIAPQTLKAVLAEIFTSFEKLFSETNFERTYFMAGSKFVVRSVHESYLAAADAALLSGCFSNGSTANIAVVNAGEKFTPKLLWEAPFFNERDVEAELADTQYRLHYFPEKSFWQVFDREARSGIQIMAGPREYPVWDPGSPLRNFFQWHLSTMHGALIHAGTLAVGEKGVLLAGAGGSGKSGTVLSGIMNGLKTAGDDYVYVEPDSLKAHALFETLKQDRKGLKRLGLIDHPAIPHATNWQGKFQFFLSDLKPSAKAHFLNLHALLLPTVAGGVRTRITPISAKEAFLSLAPSGVAQIPGDRHASFSVAAEVSRRLPCYRMTLGSDPKEISDTLRTFICEVLR